MLNTGVKVSLERETGKAVLNTARVKTTWMHWLGDTINDTRLVDLEVPVNIIFHFRNYTFKEKMQNHEKFYAKKVIFPNFNNTLVSNILKLNDSFVSRF